MPTSILRDHLGSHDPDLRGPAFEALVLEAVGVEIDEYEEVAAAYRHLSEGLIRRAASTRSGGIEAETGSRFAARHLDAVWGLVYGWRTFEVARRLMNEFPPGPGGVVEVGSGWGPYALQAELQGREARLIEASSGARGMALRMREVLGLPEPEFIARAASTRDAEGASLVALPFSLWEIRSPDEPEKTGRWLRSWLKSANDGAQLHLVEAGSRDASMAVQAVRDVLDPDLVLGPCQGVPLCPRRAANDWCHFTWRSRPGDFTRRIADLAGRRWQEQHVSWLALGAQADGRDALRVLGTRRRGKAKVEAEVCGPEGLLRLTALTRQKDAAKLIDDLEPGDVIAVPSSQLAAKGDGLRLLGTAGVERIVG